MPEIVLVCEGKDDEPVLDAVIQRAGLFVKIRNASGAKANVVRNLLANPPFATVPTTAISVVDRDYRSRADAVATWANSKSKELIWRRHEIENFLIEPYVLQEVFERYRREVGSIWTHQLPADESHVTALLHECARTLFTDHIANFLIEEVRRHFWQVTTTFQHPGGDPFHKLPVEWQQEIWSEIEKFQNECRQITGSNAIDLSWIQQRWTIIQQEVEAPDFFTSYRYLRDMKGKRLRDAIFDRVQNLLGGKLDKDDFRAKLVEAFSGCFHPGITLLDDDFEELEQRLRVLGA